MDLSGGLAERWSLKNPEDILGGRNVLPELSDEMKKQSYISCCVHRALSGGRQIVIQRLLLFSFFPGERLREIQNCVTVN